MYIICKTNNKFIKKIMIMHNHTKKALWESVYSIRHVITVMVWKIAETNAKLFNYWFEKGLIFIWKYMYVNVIKQDAQPLRKMCCSLNSYRTIINISLLKI